MSQNTEIKYDDLDYQPNDIFLHDGQPFTGVTIDRNDRGMKISEVPFLEGRPHGTARAWHDNGQCSLERPYVCGASQGSMLEWSPDGALTTETSMEFGVMMRRKVRDPEGRMVEVFNRPPLDVLYQNVLKRRSQTPPF